MGLGKYTAGVWGNSEELRQAILTSGKIVEESFWPMPLSEEHEGE